jgi:hypothetical protein
MLYERMQGFVGWVFALFTLACIGLYWLLYILLPVALVWALLHFALKFW